MCTVFDNPEEGRISPATEKALNYAEDLLRCAGGFEGVKILTTRDFCCDYDSRCGNKYLFNVEDSNSLSFNCFFMDITNANHNVSLFLNRMDVDVGGQSELVPTVNIEVTLISFDSTIVENHVTHIELGSHLTYGDEVGMSNWMTGEQFSKYVKDGKFAIGWTTTVEP